MVSLTVYSVVIFSHRYLDSVRINKNVFIPGCLLVHLNIIIQQRHQSSKFFKWHLTMLNNVFNSSILTIGVSGVLVLVVGQQTSSKSFRKPVQKKWLLHCLHRTLVCTTVGSLPCKLYKLLLLKTLFKSWRND